MSRTRHDVCSVALLGLLVVAGMLCALTGEVRGSASGPSSGWEEVQPVEGADPALLPQAVRSRGGLAVLLGGADDPDGLVAFAQEGPWVIQVLDARDDAVESARRVIDQRGLYGPLSVEHWEGSKLPHTENLVNLILVRAGGPPVDSDELLRVLAPGGAAYRVEGGKVERLWKSRPAEMDEWTHPWHGPDGSPSSTDTAFGVPNAFQWIAGPTFPRSSRGGSTMLILSAGGRTFYITYNVPENLPPRDEGYFLVARDAFNGIKLWSRPWEGPSGPGFGSVNEAVVAMGERVYAASSADELLVLDAATGAVLEAWPTEGRPDKLALVERMLVAQCPGGLTAFDIDTGKVRWRHPADSPWGMVVGDGQVYALSSSREMDGQWLHELHAVGLKDGKARWRRPIESKFGHVSTAALRLNFAGSGVICMVEYTSIRFLSAEDGGELWRFESAARSRDLTRGMDSRQAGHFLIDGLAWIRDYGVWTAHHPITGEVVRTMVGPTRGANRACQTLTASGRFGLAARHGMVWDRKSGELEP